MIPFISHQFWYQSLHHLPKKYAKQRETLMAMNSEYEHMLWDHAALRRECARYGDRCLAKYDSFCYLHQRVDLGRYVVLYNHGGISVDMDVISLKPLSIPGSTVIFVNM